MSLETPRILHIVWNLIRGGTEGQCARVALELAQRGVPQRVAVFRREGFFVEPVEQATGLLYELPIRRMASLDTLAAIRQLAAFIRHERFDLVHCWDADADIFGPIAARWAGIPFITSRRDLGEIYPSYKLWLMHRSDRRARAVVVNAEAIRRQALARGLDKDKILLIPNIMDVEEFDALSGGEGYEALKTTRNVVMVARLDTEKDAMTFLRAAHRIADRFPSVRFVLAGDGPQRPALEAFARDNGLMERVVFLGDVTDVPVLLSRCHVGVLVPTANEGLSNTILEYMAARLPVVASDCGGNRELVRDRENGLIVPAGDAEKTAEAIARLLSDNGLANTCGRHGRSRVEQAFRPSVVGDQFLSLYRRRA